MPDTPAVDSARDARAHFERGAPPPNRWLRRVRIVAGVLAVALVGAVLWWGMAIGPATSARVAFYPAKPGPTDWTPAEFACRMNGVRPPLSLSADVYVQANAPDQSYADVLPTGGHVRINHPWFRAEFYSYVAPNGAVTRLHLAPGRAASGCIGG